MLVFHRVERVERSARSFPDLALGGGGQWDGGMVFVELSYVFGGN